MHTNQKADWPDIPKRRDTVSTNLTCPRCGKDTMHPEPVRNARSRVDNETLICSPCGTHEALIDFHSQGKPMTKELWAETIKTRLDAAGPGTKLTLQDGVWEKLVDGWWKSSDGDWKSNHELAVWARES